MSNMKKATQTLAAGFVDCDCCGIRKKPSQMVATGQANDFVCGQKKVLRKIWWCSHNCFKAVLKQDTETCAKRLLSDAKENIQRIKSIIARRIQQGRQIDKVCLEQAKVVNHFIKFYNSVIEGNYYEATVLHKTSEEKVLTLTESLQDKGNDQQYGLIFSLYKCNETVVNNMESYSV